MTGADTTPQGASPEAAELALVAAQAVDSKGGTDLVVLDVARVCSFCEVFVLATGRSDRQVRTMAEAVEVAARLHRGERPLRVEGMAGGEWAVLDYGDVVVHLFDEATRSYYSLERLWSDAARLEWEPASSAPGVSGS